MVKREKRKIVFLVLSIILILSLFHGRVIAIGTGTGLGSGIGGSNGDITNAMQVAQMILQVVSQMFGNLKTDLQSNSQAESARLAKINAPRLPDDPADTQKPEILSTETSDNRVAIDFTGLELILSDRNTGNKLIIQNRASAVGRVNTNKSLENTITENTTTIITKNNVDLGVVKVGNETTLIDFGGASVEKVSGSEGFIDGFLPLVSAGGLDNLPTQFSKQYVVFVEKDIFINGNDILFFPLKDYDKIILNGSRLILMEQDSDFVTNEDRSFYSRKIVKSNFFVNKIINENNKEISFSLLNGGTKGTYLIDNKKRLTVGEAVVQNPLEDYENISIPKTRLAMWKKAA